MRQYDNLIIKNGKEKTPPPLPSEPKGSSQIKYILGKTHFLTVSPKQIFEVSFFMIFPNLFASGWALQGHKSWWKCAFLPFFMISPVFNDLFFISPPFVRLRMSLAGAQILMKMCMFTVVHDFHRFLMIVFLISPHCFASGWTYITTICLTVSLKLFF